MKITVYTIKDCAFSKQEKEYLIANQLTYEEKDLETNKDFLTEMLAISNNFAGTPVTRVEKDDGTIAVLKGFTKEEFDTTFGLAPAPVVEVPAVPVVETPSVVAEAPPVAKVPPAEVVPPVPPVVETPNPLQSVMDDLQAKVADTTTPVVETPITEVPQAEVATPPVVEMPDIPAVPDFPANPTT